MSLECQPAYGRDYKSAKEVKAAWAEGKDWQIVEMGPHYGQYVNKDSNHPGLLLRYKKLTQIVVIKAKND